MDQQAEVIADTPYADTLRRAVADAYDAFGRGHVSAGLEVCLCPVCMTEETRQNIIATPNDQLSPALIAEYRNSAHGVPVNLDDLRLLLPRYLELMACDIEVDYIGVGVELSRFGDAYRYSPDFLSKRQQQAFETWARAMILHFAWLDQADQAVLSPFYLTEVLLAGGVSVAIVTDALEAVFADAKMGQGALSNFAAACMSEHRDGAGVVKVDLWALRYCTDTTRQALADWLNGFAASERVLEQATDPDREDEWGAVQSLVWASGRFAKSSFPAQD